MREIRGTDEDPNMCIAESQQDEDHNVYIAESHKTKRNHLIEQTEKCYETYISTGLATI